MSTKLIKQRTLSQNFFHKLSFKNYLRVYFPHIDLQGSISPTFFAHVFCGVFHSNVFFFVTFWFARKKHERKTLVKSTPSGFNKSTSFNIQFTTFLIDIFGVENIVFFCLQLYISVDLILDLENMFTAN